MRGHEVEDEGVWVADPIPISRPIAIAIGLGSEIRNAWGEGVRPGVYGLVFNATEGDLSFGVLT